MLLAVVGSAGCGHEGPPISVARDHDAAPEAWAALAPIATSASNIRDADYVGPAVCAECHSDKHASWRDGLHRSMNRLVAEGPEVVRGDFSGVRRQYAGGEVRFEGGRDR